jgi:hypothetical protein
MKGVIFNLFEAFIVETFGEEAWEKVLDASPHDAREVRVGPLTYPDSHLMHLVGAACQVSGLPPEQAVRAFGRFVFGGLARKYPDITSQFTGPREMLEGIDSVIHVEVNKMLPGAQTPRVVCQAHDDGSLTLTYESSRKLCTLLEGLLDGLEAHYGVAIERRHDVCMHRGAPRCELRLTLSAARAAA